MTTSQPQRFRCCRILTFAVFRILDLGFYPRQFKLGHLLRYNLDPFSFIRLCPSPSVIYVFCSVRV